MLSNSYGGDSRNGGEVLVPPEYETIIPIDIAEEDDTLESDDDVACSSEVEVMSDV